MRWVAGIWAIGCVNIESGKGPDTGPLRSIEEPDSAFVDDCTEARNDTPEQATVVGGLQTNINLCERDEDFYEVSISPGEWLSLTMNIDGSGHNGTDQSDLDLWELNRPGDPVPPELDRYSADLDTYDVIWSSVAHDTLERLAWFNPTNTVQQRLVMVNGFDGATARYALSTTNTPWAPEVPCTQGCNELLLFPQAHDLSDGYVVTQWTQYSHVRRAVAYSIQKATAAVVQQMPNTSPLGLGDMSQYDAETPGLMEEVLRHAAGSHTHGNHIDVAYYQHSGDNLGRAVCENDGAFCTDIPDLLDAETTAIFANELLHDPMVEKIVMDPKIREAVISVADALGLEHASRLPTLIESGADWPRRYIFMDIEYVYADSEPIEE